MWEWKRAFVAAVLMVAAGASGAEAGSCTSTSLPSWTSSAPPLQDAVYGPASTTFDGKIYVASGGTFPTGGSSVQFQSYDPVSNGWTQLPNAPAALFAATLAYAGGRLWLFGGVTTTTQSAVYVYDFATNTWGPGPSMPSPRYAMASGVIGGKIYLVGGNQVGANGAQDQNWEFDPATGIYTNRLPLPTPQARAGSAVTGGRLHVVAGHNQLGNLVTTHYAYNPVTDTWQQLADITFPVNQAGATTIGAQTPACHGDIMIVSGGTPALGPGGASDPSHAPDSVAITQIYDVGSNTWSAGPSLSTGRFALRAEQVGDTIIAFGGYAAPNTVATVERMQGFPLPVALQSFGVE